MVPDQEAVVVPTILGLEGVQEGPSTDHQQVQAALGASQEVPVVLQEGPSKDLLREALEALEASREVPEVPVVLQEDPPTDLPLALQALGALEASREVLEVHRPLEALEAFQADPEGLLEVHRPLEALAALGAFLAYLEELVVHRPLEALGA